MRVCVSVARPVLPASTASYAPLTPSLSLTVTLAYVGRVHD
jgi:hypothetical protein